MTLNDSSSRQFFYIKPCRQLNTHVPLFLIVSPCFLHVFSSILHAANWDISGHLPILAGPPCCCLAKKCRQRRALTWLARLKNSTRHGGTAGAKFQWGCSLWKMVVQRSLMWFDYPGMNYIKIIISYIEYSTPSMEHKKIDWIDPVYSTKFEWQCSVLI